MAEEIVKPPEQQSKEELAISIAAEQAKLAMKPEEPAPTAVDAESEPEPEPEAPHGEKQKFEYVASDGTRYEAESQEALLKKVTSALDNTKAALKDREHKLREAKTKPVVEAPVEEVAPATKHFDREKWVELMQTDPIAAQRYINKHTLGVDNPEEVLQSMTMYQRQMAINSEVAKFYNTAAGREYKQVETEDLNAVLLDYMNREQMPPTANNYRSAYYELKEAGIIPEVQQKAGPRPKAPPPSAKGGRSETNSDPEPDLYRMSKEELRSYAKKHGMTIGA